MLDCMVSQIALYIASCVDLFRPSLFGRLQLKQVDIVAVPSATSTILLAHIFILLKRGLSQRLFLTVTTVLRVHRVPFDQSLGSGRPKNDKHAAQLNSSNILRTET